MSGEGVDGAKGLPVSRLRWAQIGREAVQSSAKGSFGLDRLVLRQPKQAGEAEGRRFRGAVLGINVRQFC